MGSEYKRFTIVKQYKRLVSKRELSKGTFVNSRLISVLNREMGKYRFLKSYPTKGCCSRMREYWSYVTSFSL